MPVLAPGIGAQGVDTPSTVKAVADSKGNGMMITSTRAILYASGDDDWREAAAHAARSTRDAINAAR
jgi:orotidine-5'-phosphate decarboxylase